MRKIKFRAWDKKNNKWYMPPKITDSNIGIWMMTTDGRTYVKGKYQELELNQFTGLQDSRDTDIYEGDVVKYRKYMDEENFVIEIIKDITEMWALKLASGIVVMGNIYENPELIKGE